MIHKTTNKHFDLFVNESSFWLSRLGLRDYEVRFVHMESEDNGSRAWVEADSENRQATFGLEVNWLCEQPTDYNISKSAFHECCELLLHNVHEHLRNMYAIHKTNELVHSIIRTLENLVFEEYWHTKRKKK